MDGVRVRVASALDCGSTTSRPPSRVTAASQIERLVTAAILRDREPSSDQIDRTDGGSSNEPRPPLRTSVRVNNDVGVDEFVELAQIAEAGGIDQIWVSNDLFFRSAPVMLAAAAVATRSIGLGTCVLNPYSMHPAEVAMVCATLQELSGGPLPPRPRRRGRRRARLGRDHPRRAAAPHRRGGGGDPGAVRRRRARRQSRATARAGSRTGDFACPPDRRRSTSGRCRPACTNSPDRWPTARSPCCTRRSRSAR